MYYDLFVKYDNTYKKGRKIMKKLNKKGFTLVELLAVIVILALLMVVVATTVMPLMNDSKKSAFTTYAQKFQSTAMGQFEGQKVLNNFASGQPITVIDAATKKYCGTLKSIMGTDGSQYDGYVMIDAFTPTNVVYYIKMYDVKNGISYGSNVTGSDGTVTPTSGYVLSTKLDKGGLVIDSVTIPGTIACPDSYDVVTTGNNINVVS